MHKEERHILWKTAAALLGAALPLILIGRAVMAICLILGVIIGLVATKDTSLRSSVMIFFKSKVVRLVLGMFCAFALSSVFAVDMHHSFYHLLQLFGLAVTAALLYLVLREMPTRFVHETLRAFCISLIVMMVLAVLDGFLNDQRLSSALHGRKWNQLHRLNFMSSTLAVMLPLFWAWLVRVHRSQEKLAHWFALPLGLFSFLAVFVCGGRAGWVAVTLAALVFLWISGYRHHLVLHRRHWLMGITAVILGPLSYGLARGFDVMKARVDIFNEKLGVGSGRLEIWKFASEHFADNPLTGIGLGNFPKLPLPAEGIVSNAHPHNFIIQLYLETGLIGLTASLAFILYVLMQFRRFAEGTLYGLAGFAGLIAFFVASLANTSIFQPWWLIFFIFIALFGARIGWSEGR